VIEEIALRGFKSYPPYRTERIGFTRGVNKISGRNAAGKTTLLEAVVYGLYGEIPKVDNRELIPLGGDGVNVTVTLRSPLTGQQIKIHREGIRTKDGGFRTTRSVMTVEGEDHPYARAGEIQSRLRELLGIGRNTFLNVVYARQKDFIEILNPQRNRMDAILGLTTPAEIREEFREVKKVLNDRGRINEKGIYQERIRNAETSIAEGEKNLEEAANRKRNLEEGLQEMRSRLFDAKGKVNDLGIFLDEFGRLDGLQAEIDKLEALRDDRMTELENAQNSLGAAPDERLTELKSGMESSRSTEERLQHLIDQELDKERADVAGEVSRLRHEINEHAAFKDRGLTVCPTCGQEIDYQLIETDLEKWQREIAERESRLRALDREIETIKGQVKVARDRWIRADREIAELETLMGRAEELAGAITKIVEQGTKLASRLEGESNSILEKAEKALGLSFASVPSAQAKLEDELREAREELRVLLREVGNREGQLKDAERQTREIEERISDHRRVLEEANEVMAHIGEYEAKVRALDGIQALYDEYGKQLRENTLAQLEYQTYQYFRRLTDQQLYGSCSIDRESYTLEIYPLGGSGKLPAWRAGGGHESLFALAERLALLRVMGFPHLLVLDEPTDAVDSENIPQLLEYVARSSREIGQVLLVTHHGHGEEEGVNLITVRKEKGESRVHQEGPVSG